MRNTIYIPPKVRHDYKGMMYYTDFERHVGRALPKAHRAVISRLESLRVYTFDHALIFDYGNNPCCTPE
ncbi:MAG: hypothetical protein K2M94_02155 [Paramuribaculum sp.]|nr:hypothetical protein [Paramuribaculum sp.]